MNQQSFKLPIFINTLDDLPHSRCLDDLRSQQEDFNSHLAYMEELKLRGFIIDKPMVYGDYLIDCEYASRRLFQKIPFESLGLGDIVSKFHIENDCFFHRIPLNGFLLLNPHINLSELKLKLIESGFQLKRVPLKTIEHVYHESSFTLFRHFCQEHHLYYVEELSEPFIKNLENEKGFGRKKVLHILEYYDAYMNHKKKDNDEILLTIPIGLQFNDKKFDHFRLFCQEHDLTLISDLTDEILDSYSVYRGVGKKKYQYVIDELKRIQDNYIKTREMVFHIDNLQELERLNLSIKQLLELFEIEQEGLNDIYLSDFQDQSFAKLSKYLTLDKLSYLYRALSSYSKIKEILEMSIQCSVVKKRDQYVFHHRMMNGMTLEEVAKELGLTRERVRQVAYHLLDIMHQRLLKDDFYKLLYLKFYNQQVFYEADLKKIFKNHYKVLVQLAAFDFGPLYYDSKFDFYSFERIVLNDPPLFVEKRSYYLKKELIASCLETWGTILKNLTPKRIEEILKNVYHLIDNGLVFATCHLSKTQVIEILFKYVIKGRLRIDDQGAALIRELSLRYLNYSLDGISSRSIEAKARDIDSLLLVGKKEFVYYHQDANYLALVKHVQSYLDEYFKQATIIEAGTLYEKFEEEARLLGIDHDIGLYSLVKMYYHDAYTFSTGNQKCISKTSKSSL